MNFSSQFLQNAIPAAKGGFVAGLCCALAMPQAYASTADKSAGDVPVVGAVAPLTQNQRVEHALNRFTFGPRPGDAAAVSRMGLEAWFQQQLQPRSVDDSALEAQLAKFPALQLSQEELIRRFPSPQMIRAGGRLGRNAGRFARNEDRPMPSDPAERAIYEDAIYDYQMSPKGQQGTAAKKAETDAGDDAMMLAGQAANADGMQSASSAHAADPGNEPAMADATASGQGKKGGRKQMLAAAAPRRSDSDVQAVLALAPEDRYNALLAMSPRDMLSLRTGLRPFERLQLMRGLTPAQTEVVAALTGQPVRVVGAETLEARLLRDVESNRQLEAVMTDFWLNHFSVYARKNQNEPYFLSSYERDTILPHALGKFENLLVATAESPAMLMYLDNWQSVGPDSPAAQRGKRVQQFADSNPNRPGIGRLAQLMPKGINENYARELMELHTLGERCEVSADHPASQLEPSCGNGYTQADVQNVAKVLTGWTIERPYQGGKMVFDENRHESGDKVVLGKTIRAGGYKEGMEVLHMLATSPATAHFISYKLAVRFVSDNPPEALVDRMAATFLKSDGEVKAVLATMFHSPEFWTPEVYRAKIKTPIEFVASALRASDATIHNALPLVQAMDKLGMPIYGMQTPNGYSWEHDSWVSSNALISRMNFALVLSGDLLPGTRTDWPQLLGQGDSDRADAETERKLETLLLGQPAAERTRLTVLQEAKNPTAQHAAQQSFAAAKAQDDDMADAGAELGKQSVLPRRGGRQGGALQAYGPEAPLNTMAGLLLGSPEFQRR